MRLRPIILSLVVALASPAPGLTQDAGSTTTSTVRGTALPACPVAGAACGSCGPVGQCLYHIDTGPPPRVCVDGGQCVQVECGADAQCPAGQVCAALGGLSACCRPCP